MYRPSIFIVIYFWLACNSSTQIKPAYHELTDPVGEANARKRLQQAKKNEGQLFTRDTLIKRSSTAVAIAETFLFEFYGKEQILAQQPYEVYYIDGYWYISGTVPHGSDGGGFEIILNAKNAQIIKLIHYK